MSLCVDAARFGRGKLIRIHKHIDTVMSRYYTTWGDGMFSSTFDVNPGSDIYVHLSVGSYNNTTSWGGLYTYLQWSQNGGAWEGSGNSGYMGSMCNGRAKQGNYDNIVKISNVDGGTLQVKMRHAPYNGGVYVNSTGGNDLRTHMIITECHSNDDAAAGSRALQRAQQDNGILRKMTRQYVGGAAYGGYSVSKLFPNMTKSAGTGIFGIFQAPISHVEYYSGWHGGACFLQYSTNNGGSYTTIGDLNNDGLYRGTGYRYPRMFFYIPNISATQFRLSFIFYNMATKTRDVGINYSATGVLALNCTYYEVDD